MRTMQDAISAASLYLAWQKTPEMASFVLDQLIPDDSLRSPLSRADVLASRPEVVEVARRFMDKDLMFRSLIVTTITFRIAYYYSAGCVEKALALAEAWSIRDYSSQKPPITDLREYA